MFGIGIFEAIIIAVAALIFIGPDRLPKVAKQFGHFFVHIRRMSNEVRTSFEQAIKDAEIEIASEEREKLKKLLSVNQQNVQEMAMNAMSGGSQPVDAEKSRDDISSPEKS